MNLLIFYPIVRVNSVLPNNFLIMLDSVTFKTINKRFAITNYEHNLL